MACRLLLLALVLGACESAPSSADPRPTDRADGQRAASPPEGVDAPNTPFDAAEIVFDTTEPPEQIVQIPPRPTPPPRPPQPRLSPPPSPQPPRGSAGRCDVRGTESYCFTYTGEGWTPETARAQCGAAPDASFAPGACPLDGRIATCAFERESAPGREIVYTYYEPYEMALAALACPGTFTRIE